MSTIVKDFPKIIAGTGHRPKYCPCKYNEKHPWLLKLKDDIRNFYEKASPEYIITGMAIGWDTWIAEVALEMNIPIHCYIPFENQHSKWPKKSKEKYEDILSKEKDLPIINFWRE